MQKTSFLVRVLQGIQRPIVHLLIEVPAKRAGMDRIIASLEKSGQALLKRAGAASGRPVNLAILAHLVGIERWGQRRVQVALGEPLILEEYDSYRPVDRDWLQLVESFQATRQETISLSKTLRMAGVDPQTRIPHNQMGELSLLGWLYYLNLHARIESLKMT